MEKKRYREKKNIDVEKKNIYVKKMNIDVKKKNIDVKKKNINVKKKKTDVEGKDKIGEERHGKNIDDSIKILIWPPAKRETHEVLCHGNRDFSGVRWLPSIRCLFAG